MNESTFDHNAPEFGADMRAGWRALLEKCPVARSEQHGGFWVLTRYADVSAAARDDATFSSARHPAGSELASTMIPQIPTPPLPPFEMDPPESQPLRRFLNRLMTVTNTEKVMLPLLDEVSDFCLDQVVERGECDLVEDVLGPIAALFTLIWLGMPTDDWQRFVRLQHNAVSYPHDAPEFAEAVADYSWQSQMIQDTIRARRQQSTADVISYLLAQELDGHPVTDELVTQIVGLLIAGGTHTLTSLTGQSLHYLASQPRLRAKLLHDEELLDSAAEEFLRYFTPAPALARTVMRDVTVGGRKLKAGDRALMSWAAANQDPAEFPDPDRLDVCRRPNRHLSFGVGTHRCVGSHLGRRGAQLIIQRVLQRMPDYTIDPADARPNPVQALNSGWSSLPCRFTPSPSRRTPLPTLKESGTD
jgi:cytochrome P450